MPAKGLKVIDHTVQSTHEWFNELQERLQRASARDVLLVFRVTIPALRDRLGMTLQPSSPRRCRS